MGNVSHRFSFFCIIIDKEMKNRIQILNLFMIAIIVFNSCSSSTENEPVDSDHPEYDSMAVVTCAYVSDGDTWNFYYSDKKFTVRVLHVDCFETREGERLNDQAEKAGISPDSALKLGKAAKYLAEDLLEDKEVTIVRDHNEDNKDVYDRLLRITIIDGQRLDSIMIARGYGFAY